MIGSVRARTRSVVAIATFAALVCTALAVQPISACSMEKVRLRDIVQGSGPTWAGPPVDTVALVTVLDVHGPGPWTYTLGVERLIGGRPVGDRWLLGPVSASDCGMPRLKPGGRYVLEYWRAESRSSRLAWFFAWVLHPDDEPRSGVHEALPATFAELERLYRAAGLELPDTSTELPRRPTSHGLALISAIAGLLGGLSWLGRQGAPRRHRAIGRAADGP
jgi:hypothetical protein